MTTTGSTFIHEDAPPAYTDTDPKNYLTVETTPISRASLSSAASSLLSNPSSTFIPTTNLQIEAVGKEVISKPDSTTATPIPVYRVSMPDSTIATTPTYISIRPSRAFGTCALVRASDQSPLITTTYRFGPGKPPKMHVLPASSSASEPLSVKDALALSKEIKDGEHPDGGEAFTVRSRSLTSHSQTITTRHGTYEWRYGSRAERKEDNADCLLILERIESAAVGEKKGKKDKEQRTRVAQFVRNKALRTKASRKYSAGNGGRLMVDLEWVEEEKREEVEAFVVASCICMLKKEVDRLTEAQWVSAVAGLVGNVASP